MTDQATFEVESAALLPTTWDEWIGRVEKLMRRTHPDWNADGDQEQDGYSLDYLFEYFQRGKRPLDATATIRWRMRGLHRNTAA